MGRHEWIGGDMPGTDDPWGNGGQASGGAPDLATEARRARLARDDRPEAGIWPAPSDGRTVAMEDVRGDDPHELTDLRAAASPLFGVDLHPTFQAGFSVDQAAGQGIGFLACKVSEGTWTYDSRAWLARAKTLGIPAVGYCYLHPGSEDAQARVFAAQLAASGVPGMLDAEALTTGVLGAAGDPAPLDSGGMGQRPHPGGGTMRASELRHGATVPAATLTVDGIRLFLNRCTAYGADVRLSYLPYWYWQRMGSPSLAGLPPLWASSYPSNATGTPGQLYPAVTPSRWASYGGLPVRVLQFSQTGIAGGIQPVDLDAYLGSKADLAALLGIPTPSPIRRPLRMRQIHLTNTDADLADLSGVLTIDAVGTSAVMPAGSRAWLQWAGVCMRDRAAKAHVWWLVERHADGTHLDIGPFDVAHGQSGARELSRGTVAVEIGLEKVPPGFAFSAHLDGIGHA